MQASTGLRRGVVVLALVGGMAACSDSPEATNVSADETTTTTEATTTTASTTTMPPTTTVPTTTTTTAAPRTTTTVPRTTTTRPSPTTTTTTAVAAQQANCDPSHPDVCIPSPPPDLDCGEISHRNFRVVGSDPHGFDGNDNDGYGCES